METRVGSEGGGGSDLGASSPGHRVYASSSGFLWGQQPVGTYDSSCLRSIAWKMANRDVRGNIPPEYAVLGAKHELLWADQLQSEGAVYHRELPIKSEIRTPKGTSVTYSGRADFILPGSVDETKATYSKSAPFYILKKGTWKISHLAQLVGYLWQLELRYGRIVCGVYEFRPEEIFTGTEYHLIGIRTFHVSIADDGQIFVDSKPTPYYVQDQIAHVQAAAQVVAEQKVWHVRPYGWNNKWGSPCAYCPFQKLCDRYDAGEVSEFDTFAEARTIIQGGAE